MDQQLVDRNDAIGAIATIMSSSAFKDFMEAEAKLLTYINELSGDVDFVYFQNLENLSKSVNKFLTFKCIPWKK